MAEMFAPKTTRAADEAADIFWAAENAYFSAANFLQQGELWLEPLLGRTAGPPDPPAVLSEKGQTLFIHPADPPQALRSVV